MDLKCAENLSEASVGLEKIRQVMINFIDNSIKYADKGLIEVKVETASGKRVKEMIKKSCQYKDDKLNLKSGARFIVFSVSDSGRGVTEDDQYKLFKKFSRGEGVYTVHTDGNGLGLYVCKSPLIPL